MTERADIVLLLFFWPLFLVDRALGISDGKGEGKGKREGVGRLGLVCRLINPLQLTRVRCVMRNQMDRKEMKTIDRRQAVGLVRDRPSSSPLITYVLEKLIKFSIDLSMNFTAEFFLVCK